MKLELYHDDFQKTYPLIKGHDYRRAIEVMAGRKAVYRTAPPPQRGAYHYLMGLCYSKIGDYHQADEHFNATCAAVPGMDKVKLEIADSLLQRGSLKDAEHLLLEIYENQMERYGAPIRRLSLLMGKYFKLTGDYTAARQCYMEAYRNGHPVEHHQKDIQLMDDFISASSDRASATRGIMEYAHHLFHLDLNGTPKTELSIVFLGNCLKTLTRIDDKVNCLASLSQHSLGLGKMDAAFEYSRQALALDANHPRSLAGRIRLYIESGQWDKAITHYTEDKDIIKDDPRATLALAKTFNFSGCKGIAHELVSYIANTARDVPEDILPDVQRLKANTAPRKAYQPR